MFLLNLLARLILASQVLLLKHLLRVFGLSLDDDNFNLVIFGHQVGDLLALGHVEDPLLNRRHRQLLPDRGRQQLSRKFEIDA